MPELNLENAGSILTGVGVYVGLVLVAFWLTMIVWAYRDMRSRSRDTLGGLLAAVLVAVLMVPGLIIYLLLRPRETLSEAYERSLEEEALLQEIEEKPTCPGCKTRVQPDWQACPLCHTRLKKPCHRCGQMLDLAWNLCPYCATPQAQYSGERNYAPARTAAVPEAWPASYERRDVLEFVDQED